MPLLSPNNTYQLTKPLHTPVTRALLFVGLCILALSFLTHGISQLPLSASLPPRTLDTRNPEFNAKINYLEAFARRHGKVDCLLLGNSHIDYGLNPAIITETYKTATRREIHCFNFGLASLTADTTAPLARMLVRRYQPRLLVLAVSAHSFDKRFGDLARPLLKNPWVLYQLGEPRLEGWALEHISLYGYYRAFKLWQQPYSRDVMLNTWQKMDANGYSAHDGQQPPEKDGESYEFYVESSNWQGFQDTLSLNGLTHLILLEAPLMEASLPNYIQGGREAYEIQFVPLVSAAASEKRVPFWRAQVEVAPHIPASMWFDAQHLNAGGAAFLSEWLAQKMAQELPSTVFP